MGGVRLSGRAGRQTVGFLSILQDQAFGDPRTNFGALRVKRDVGQNGFVGAMLTDRRTRAGGETDGGVDFSLWPTRRLNVTGFAALHLRRAGTARGTRPIAWPRSTAPAGSSCRAQHLLVGPDAETGMGFVTRTDIRRSDAFGAWTFRPGSSALREIETFVGGAWITRTTGEEQDGEAFAGGGLRFESGDSVSAFATRGFTQLDEAFDLADRVAVPVGRYDLRQLTVFASSSPSRRSASPWSGRLADEWDGRVRSLETTLRVAVGPHLEAGPTLDPEPRRPARAAPSPPTSSA